jgi:SynChlorMet cassette radical SAM/SPASM protein ScmF
MVDAGVRPQIVMTLTKRNVHQIQTVIDLAEHEGAESVKINILLLIARGKNLHDQGDSLSLSELIEIGARIEHEIAPSTKMPVIFSHPHAFQPLNRMVDERYSCGNCHIHQIMGVLHDGSYALCGIGFTVPELVFGKAGKNRLSDLWGYHPLLQKIREGIPNQLKSPCRECVMKHRCLGCCVAQNFVASHDLLAPYWYCEEAVKQGLFPETRLME